MYLIYYRHLDCPSGLQPGWWDTWDCACNGECPECGTKDIEPIDWEELRDEEDTNYV